MQYITNKTKGGIRYVAERLIPVYGSISEDSTKIRRSESVVTHYDRDLAKVVLWTFFGFYCRVKIHIVHVDPINLHKTKFALRSVINLVLYKLASGLGWHFIFISRENYAKYQNYVRAEYVLNPVLDHVEELNRQRLSINDPIKFVNMGRFDFQKNQRQILNFIDLMDHDFPGNKYEYHLYGDGALLNSFKNEMFNRELDHKIFLHDWTDSVLVDLRKYDIYLQSSFWEGLPTVVVQALSQGLSILTFPLASSASLLEDSSYIDKYFRFDYFLENSVEKVDLTKYTIARSLEEHKKLYEKLRILHI